MAKSIAEAETTNYRELTDRLCALGALFTRLGDDADAAYSEASLEAPRAHIRRRLELDVLTPGGAVSLLPVESLYKTWSNPRKHGQEPCAFGGATHLYMGDSAHHVRALMDSLEIEVPIEFSAMPDHIVLLSELASIYGEAGNVCALKAFTNEHFDWIQSYAAELAEHKSSFADIPNPSQRTIECKEAIEHVLGLLEEVVTTLNQLQQELMRIRTAA